jgi:para-aminobenzoate synthetase component 1
MQATLLVHEIDKAWIPSDPLAWVSAFADCPGLAFLDSALRPEKLGLAGLGRYSFIAADPFHLIEAKGSVTRVDGVPAEGTPFDVLQNLLAKYPVEHRPDLPPFQTGAAGYFGYDLRHHTETLPPHRLDDQPFPDLLLGFYDLVIAIDHLEGRAFLLSSGYPELTADARALRAKARLDWALRRLDAARPIAGDTSWAIASMPDLDGNRYKAMVRKTIDYIEAGDIYQANITQRFRAKLGADFDRLALYDALRRRNPATFAAYLDFGDVAILSSSPERFLQVADGQVETRPIKGTRPRGRTASEDQALAAELLASEKDRAENLMIVDLLRNDLSRVCEIGSVKAPVLFGLESFATVHHLVSVVTGRLAADRTTVDLLRAAFPGGSVTGAPKIRAMEIIAELEPTTRGPYCGAIGYLSADGGMDTNIVIRTYCILKDEISFQVGGGMVADSDPQAELEESLAKAKALIETLAQGPQVRNASQGSAA